MSNTSNIKIKIPKISREELTKKGFALDKFASTIHGIKGSIGMMYPSNLEPEKTLSIHVYDTSKYDKAYDPFLKGTQNVISNIADVFAAGINSVSSATLGKKAEVIHNDIEKHQDALFGKNSKGLKEVFKNFDIGTIHFKLGNAKLSKLSGGYLESFYLPIPNNLQESLSNSYEEKPGWINDIPGMENVRKGIEKMTVGKDDLSTATYAKMTGARSIQYYENKIQMYSSTEFREIQLSWQMVPNNEKESRDIHEIVRKLKMYGSPETAAGKLILKSPCYFRIEFNNELLDRALQFYEVVLTSIEIEYVPGGNMEMFNDEMPKHIQLNMSFRDREPKLREDWENTAPDASSSKNDASCPA